MSTTNATDYKIAIIGPKDVVSGLKVLGVEALEATTTEETLAQLRTIRQWQRDGTPEKQYAVVCVIENLIASVDQAEYAKIVDGPLPAVVVLPGPEGSQGFAVARLRALAERAVGSAII
jgi:V/A-type H+-transporting ATPase subunit F